MYISDLRINEFLIAIKKYGNRMAEGITLCILSPVILVGLSGFEREGEALYETSLVLLGLLSLFLLVAIGVMILIRNGAEIRKYREIKEGNFNLSENQREKLESLSDMFEEIYGKKIGLGVGLCILSPIPLITVAVLGMDDRIIILMVSILLIIVSIAVNLFIKTIVQRIGYMQLLKEGDYAPGNRRAAKLEETVGGIYWPVVVAIYLGWSFIGYAWTISWVIFPIAALIYAAIAALIKKY